MLLDSSSILPDRILLMDTFFQILIYHGEVSKDTKTVYLPRRGKQGHKDCLSCCDEWRAKNVPEYQVSPPSLPPTARRPPGISVESHQMNGPHIWFENFQEKGNVFSLHQTKKYFPTDNTCDCRCCFTRIL